MRRRADLPCLFSVILLADLCPDATFRDRTCKQQVQDYLARFEQGLPNSTFYPSNSAGNLTSMIRQPNQRILYLLACGFNDLNDAASSGCYKSPNSTTLPALLTGTIAQMVKSLHERAYATDFLVILPGFSLGASYIAPNLVNETDTRIIKWAAEYSASSSADVLIETVDWAPSMRQMLDDPSNERWLEYYTEVPVITKSTCLRGSPDNEPDKVAVCQDPGRYFYYDGHFSTHTHSWLADRTLPFAQKLSSRTFVPQQPHRKTSPTTTTTGLVVMTQRVPEPLSSEGNRRFWTRSGCLVGALSILLTVAAIS